jgi:UDP-N-acetylmuramate dehydrogenase
MISIKQNVPLKNLSTIHTGGNAQFFATCKNERDIIDALQHAASHSIPVTVLGGGSNSLISDNGIRGLVLKIELDGFSISSSGLTTSGAGVSWDLLVAETCRQGMTGVEALSGIPGLVGATPIQNVGAYGQEVAETIKSLRAINRKTLETRIFSNAECSFSYRNSRFKETDKDSWIITEVSFQLDAKEEPKPRYEELQKSLLNDNRWSLSNREEKLLLVREHVLKIRAQKGMVLDPSDHDTVSLGSFFTNPLIDQNTKQVIEERASSLKTKSPPVFHKSGDKLWKISAAWLIESSGVTKGFAMGKARISSKHVLAITNPGEATTLDILQLQRHVESQVLKVFNVQLQREPVFLD